MNKTRLILIFLFFLFAKPAFTLDADKAFEQISKKFANVSSIYVKFFDLISLQRGEISATKSGKYSLVFPDRKIVCNGKTIWNYNIRRKQVVVSDYQEIENLSLDNFLLEFAKKYKPIRLERENSSFASASYKLTLQNPADPSWTIDVYIDEHYNLQVVAFQPRGSRENNIGKFKIESIKKNPKFKDSKFEFRIPKGVEIIDLR